jgi:hypothetical protein
LPAQDRDAGKLAFEGGGKREAVEPFDLGLDRRPRQAGLHATMRRGRAMLASPFGDYSRLILINMDIRSMFRLVYSNKTTPN